MSAPTHCILIVEDQPETAALLVQYVLALGMRARVATTLEEVDRAIAEGGFCCATLDKELPAAAGSPPLAETGDTAQRRLRAVDPRRNTDDHHILPILIVTRVKPRHSMLTDHYRHGASGFVRKPVKPETLAKEIREALERAGRRDHAQCAALTPPLTPFAPLVPAPVATPAIPATPATPLEGPLHIVLDGLRISRRTSFLVNGKRAALQDNLFIVFLRLAAVRARGSDAYLSSSDLGIYRTPHVPSRIRSELERVVPPDMVILQRGEEGMFRLHPFFTVAPIDWKIFERHPHAGVQAIAAAERKLR